MRYVSLFILLVMSTVAFGQTGDEETPAPAAPTSTRTTGSVRLPEPPVTAVTMSAPGTPTPEATDSEKTSTVAPGGEEFVYLNVQDQDIKDVIRQISKATGKNFIIDEKVRGKVTILSEKKLTREEAYQAFLSALEVAGYTVVTGPAGIIKIVAQKDAVTYPLPIHVDTTPYTDSYITRLITLENISALDMSNAIKGLISKSGNMFAYPATNTLIITDSGTNIDRLMKIMKELDQEGPQQTIEIVPIQYADAKQVAQTVLALFQKEKAGAQPARARRGAENAAVAEEIEDVSQIIADERTNSLIIVASKRSFKLVKDIIDRIDRPGGKAQGTIHVHYLKYANAVDLAATLSSITSGQKGTTRATAATAGEGAKEGTTVSATSAVARLEGGITIGADKETNALIVTASPKDYQVLVSELISKLDIPRNQVYLESLIMELAMGKTSDYGLRGYGGLGAGPLLGFGSTFSAASQFTNFFTGDGVVGGVIGRDNIDITVPTITGGTISSQDVSIPAFAGFLNLIQTYTDANIVSSPNLLTLDNEQAEINVTQKIYANKVTQTAQGFQTTEPTPLESGLILKLTPQISEGEAVRLKIEQELSNFTGEPGASGAAPSTKRKVSTTVITNDGETVVLGGLMQDNVTHSKHKVPILGDIPILGLLFRTSQSRTAKSNLLIFITPHIIRSPSDFDIVMKRKIEERNRFIEDNYGAKQQKQIRETLSNHREDLLAFVPQAQPTPPPVTLPAPTPAPAAPPPPPVVQEQVRPQAATPPPPQTMGKQPVITAPSIDIGRPIGVPPSTAPVTPPPRTNNSSRVVPPPPPSDQPKPPTELNLAY